MKKYLASAVLSSILSLLYGCTSPPVPENYDGPLATITDTYKKMGMSTAYFFVMEEINGKKISTAIDRSSYASQGQGFFLTVANTTREIPARKIQVKLKAYTLRAAPILELLPGDFEVSGEISFSPEAEHRYFVAGRLTESYQAVWIQDEKSLLIVSDIIDSSADESLRTKHRDEIVADIEKERIENERRLKEIEATAENRQKNMKIFSQSFYAAGKCGFKIESLADANDAFNFSLKLLQDKKYAEAGSCFEFLSQPPISDRRAMKQLGAMHELGFGFKKDLKEAMIWYEKAGVISH